jgi:hypothetical protein
MGSSTLLDILGALVIGGLMLIMINSANQRINDTSIYSHSDLIVQQNMVSIAELIEHDFNRIGYCENPDSMLPPSQVIISADSNSISFWTDLAVSQSDFRGDGIKDILIYELGSLVTATPNPNDRILYRYISGQTKRGSNLGVTQFKLTYTDKIGNLLPHPIETDKIGFIQIDLKVEDSYGYDTNNPDKTYLEKFPTGFWRQLRLSTKNIN